MNFNIKDYLTEEPDDEEIKDEKWHDQFYGEIESKPETEQRLFAAQKNFIESRDMSIWKEMFQLCWAYTRSMILQRITGKKFVPPEEVDSKTTQATMNFMVQYLYNPKFEVGTSFAGMIKWKIVEVLYKNYTDEHLYSLNIAVDSSDSKAELQDLIDNDDSLLTTAIASPDDFLKKEAFTDTLAEFFNEFDKSVNYDNYLMLVIRSYVMLLVNQPSSRHAKRMFLQTWAADFKTQQLLEYCNLELKKRLFNSITN